MSLRTLDPREVTVKRGRANLFEIFQIIIDTPPGSTSVTVRRRGVMVDREGVRGDVEPIDDRLLTGDVLSAAMSDAARRLFAAAGLQVPDFVSNDLLARGLYNAIRDALYVDSQAEHAFPPDAQP